jgi:hypothetical protein
VARCLAETVAPTGFAVATDLETDFSRTKPRTIRVYKVLRHDLISEPLPTASSVRHGVTGSDPLGRYFLRLTLRELREQVLASRDVTKADYNEAVSTLQNRLATTDLASLA